ncbi:MAG: helix-turn-helix transcriptional regulator [Nitriliruptorales bacterium]
MALWCAVVGHTTPRPLWTLEQVAEFLGVTRWTVKRYRDSDPTFPPPVMLSARTVRWRPDDLEAWVASRVSAPPAAKPTRIPQVRL